MRLKASQMFELMSGDAEKLLTDIRSSERERVLQEAKDLNDNCRHDVMNKAIYKDKEVFNTTYKLDENNVPVTSVEKNLKKVIRVPLDFADYAIKQKATLTCGAGIGVDTTDSNSEAYQQFIEVYDSLKLEYRFQEVCELMMSETQVAIIFYTNNKGEYKFKLVYPSNGDVLTPIWEDDSDDMIGFSRTYKLKDETFTDLYVVGEIRRYKNDILQETIKLPFAKLPIIYFEQDRHELAKTKELFSLWEIEFSRFQESAIYFSDPMLFAKGTNVNLPTATDRGQVIYSTGTDGDAKILTPDNATDIRGLQFDLFEKYMHKLNFVAPIDFSSLQGKGNVASETLELLMVDAYMDATRRQTGGFGEGVQRAFNWIMSEIVRVNLLKDVKVFPKFRRYSLRGESERIEMYMKANGNLPIVGHKESVDLAGIANDVSFIEIEKATTE